MWDLAELISSRECKNIRGALTSGTPTPCCPEDTPASSSASGRCSGNGTHAEHTHSYWLIFHYIQNSEVQKCSEKLENSVSLTLHTPQATVHSSDVAEAWLAWHSIPVNTQHGAASNRKQELNEIWTTGSVWGTIQHHCLTLFLYRGITPGLMNHNFCCNIQDGGIRLEKDQVVGFFFSFFPWLTFCCQVWASLHSRRPQIPVFRRQERNLMWSPAVVACLPQGSMYCACRDAFLSYYLSYDILPGHFPLRLLLRRPVHQHELGAGVGSNWKPSKNWFAFQWGGEPQLC